MIKKKKHKKKFKAQLHQALQEMKKDKPEDSRVEKQTENEKDTNTETQNKLEAQKDSELPKTSVSSVVTKKHSQTDYTLEEPDKPSGDYSHVKKDVVKIIIIAVICVVILIVVWTLALKTSYISDLANTLANFSHLDQLKW